MNLYTKQTHRHRKQIYNYQRGDEEGGGTNKNMGLTGINYYI